MLSLAYLAMTARTLGAVGFGQFTLILGTGQAVAALVGFQTWQVAIRYGMAPMKEGRHAALSRLVAFCTVLDLAAALAGCVIATLGVLLLGPRLGWSPGLSRAALGFCFVMLLSIRSTAVGVLRLYDRFAMGAAADASTPIVRFIGSLAVVVTHASIGAFLAAWASAEIVTTMVYWVAARRVARPSLNLPTLHGAWKAPAENPDIWHFTWMTNFSSTLDAVGRQFSVIIVGLATGPVAAGNYRLASQLAQSVVRVSDMFSRAIFAELTRAHIGQGRIGQPRPDVQQLFRHLVRLALVAAAAVVVVLLLGKPVLTLIAGRGHAGADLPLRLLGVAAAIELAGVGFEPVLLAMGLAKRAFMLRIAATLCLVVGLAVLLPSFGAAGAATATLISSALALVLFARAAWQALRHP